MCHPSSIYLDRCPLTLACGAFSGKVQFGCLLDYIYIYIIEVTRLKSHPPVFSVNTSCSIESSHCSPQESPPSRNEPSQQSATIPKHLPWKSWYKTNSSILLCVGDNSVNSSPMLFQIQRQIGEIPTWLGCRPCSVTVPNPSRG